MVVKEAREKNSEAEKQKSATDVIHRRPSHLVPQTFLELPEAVVEDIVNQISFKTLVALRASSSALYRLLEAYEPNTAMFKSKMHTVMTEDPHIQAYCTALTEHLQEALSLTTIDPDNTFSQPMVKLALDAAENALLQKAISSDMQQTWTVKTHAFKYTVGPYTLIINIRRETSPHRVPRSVSCMLSWKHHEWAWVTLKSAPILYIAETTDIPSEHTVKDMLDWAIFIHISARLMAQSVFGGEFLQNKKPVVYENTDQKSQVTLIEQMLERYWSPKIEL